MKHLLKIGMCGSLLGMVADWALLYDPEGRYLQQPKYQFLTTLPVERMWLGHFLGIISIPFSLFALPALFFIIKANQELKNRISSYVISFLILGISYHLSLTPIRLWLDQGHDLSGPLLYTFQTLEILCGVGIAGLGYGWHKLGLKLIFNPAITYMTWAFLFFLNPNYGGLVWMMGMNLSVLVAQIYIYSKIK